MATRAGVSERCFSEIFANVEECYRAAFEEGLERLSLTLADGIGRETAWLERVRSGLVALLGFFDDEPAWARLLLLEAPVAGSQTLRCEQRLLGALTQLLDHPCVRALGEVTSLSQMTSELVAGGTFAVIRARAQEEDRREPLVELAPSLMAFIVRPYLGEVAAQAELAGRASGGGEKVADRRLGGSGSLNSADEVSPSRRASEESGLPADELVRARAISRAGELPVRATHRTTLVLRAIAQAPYSNNREVAQAAGLVDEGQTSKLLARLEGRGVIENVGVGAARGEPNAWLLTASGRRVLALLGESFADRAPRRTSRRIRGAL